MKEKSTMESRRYVTVHLSETLSTTVPYDNCFWDKDHVYIEVPSGVKTYDRSSVLELEIFEA